MAKALFSPRQLKFLDTPRIGRLATVRADGSPHVAPIWFRFEAGEFLILTERGSQKHKNVEYEPRVLLCIDDERPPYHTVLVRGRASVHDAPGRAWREELAIHYLGDEAGRRYIAENMHANDVMLRIAPEQVSGW
jgi:hypothetical protein